jgi:hypothetical protein
LPFFWTRSRTRFSSSAPSSPANHRARPTKYSHAGAEFCADRGGHGGAWGGTRRGHIPVALALLGREHVTLYDGSLEEWSADPALHLVRHG